ncbi:MAG: hypothetical protein O7J95_15630 [Planctomycetota bacterium]|nr:hypothetical protein [Planctomycetota bacterium]
MSERRTPAAKRPGVRWTLRLSCLTGIAVMALAVHVYRDPLLELWYLRELRMAKDAEAQRAVMANLAEVGGDRSVEPLTELLKNQDPALASRAGASLGDIAPRCADENAKAVVRSLLDAIPATPSPFRPPAAKGPIYSFVDALRDIARNDPRILPLLRDRLLEDDLPGLGGAAGALAAAWPAWASRVTELLDRADAPTLRRLLLNVENPNPQGIGVGVSGLLSKVVAQPLSGGGKDLAEYVRSEHQDEKARALALSFLLTGGRSGRDYEFDLSALLKSYRDDPSLVVKTAAVRLAGFLGNRTGTLPLSELLQEVRDPRLLREVVEARTLWSRYRPLFAFDLWDGFRCDWLPNVANTRGLRKPWEDAELRRLEEILRTSRDGPLRDAVSLALASRYRDLGTPRAGAPQPLRIDDLEVHEWGVWSEGEGSPGIPAKVLADLPPFVHRSQVSARQLWSERTFTPLVVFKPVVFFHSPRPQSLLVQVDFHEGRPWTYYPEATDYRLRMATVPVGRVTRLGGPTAAPGQTGSGSASGTGVKGPSASSLAPATKPAANRPAVDAREGFRPPWIPAPPARQLNRSLPFGPPLGFPAPVSPGVELTGRYELAPWLRPSSRRSANRFGFGSDVLGSVGLEWCGLRVGYEADLEGDLPEIDREHWWSRLRETRAASVAVRGERERFLFYDGSVNFPAPIRVRWSDASKRSLRLSVRNFGDYPDVPSYSEVWRRSWLSEAERERLRKTLPIPAVLVLRTRESGDTEGAVVRDLSPAKPPATVALEGLDLRGEELARRFQGLLEEQGLTDAEAHSLVRTWEKEFFATPGLRVITVLPQWIYDAVLPLRIFPAPGKTVRVGLVWKECDELEVATQVEEDPERWSPIPWRIPQKTVELESRPLELGSPRPLEWKESGEIVTGPGRAGSARLSANGRRLAFGVVDGTTYTIHLADLERRSVRTVFAAKNVEMHHLGSVVLSADGGTLAFSLAKAGEQRNYVVDLESERLHDPGKGTVVGLSADGRRLLLSTGSSLEVYDREEKRMRTVFVAESHGFSSATLSGDGRRVAFVSAATGDPEVYVVDLEAGTLLNVSRARGGDDDPALSHDGSKVIFESRRDRDFEIYLADLEARTLTNLTDRAGKDRFPHIDPAGERIIYRDWDSEFHVLDLATGEKRPLPRTESVWTIHPAWRGGRVALIRWRDRTPYISVEAFE